MSSNNENLAIQRIAKLVDENSFMEIGSLVTARSTDFNLTAAKTPSDGVVIGQSGIYLQPGCIRIKRYHRRDARKEDCVCV